MNEIKSPINQRIEIAASRVKETENRFETILAQYMKEIDYNMNLLNTRIQELERFISKEDLQEE